MSAGRGDTHVFLLESPLQPPHGGRAEPGTRPPCGSQFCGLLQYRETLSRITASRSRPTWNPIKPRFGVLTTARALADVQLTLPKAYDMTTSCTSSAHR